MDINKEKMAKGLVGMGKVKKVGEAYVIESASGKENFEVSRNPQTSKVECSCTDFKELIREDDEYRCVHILAVKEFVTAQPNEVAPPKKDTTVKSETKAKPVTKGITETKIDEVAETPIVEAKKYFTKEFKRPIQEIMEDLHKEVHPSHVKTRRQGGKEIAYMSWYDTCKYLDVFANGWSYEVKDIMNISGKIVMTVRITIQALEGSFYREATGCEDEDTTSYGDAFSNAESMALRRCASKFGLGQFLYRIG